MTAQKILSGRRITRCSVCKWGGKFAGEVCGVCVPEEKPVRVPPALAKVGGKEKRDRRLIAMRSISRAIKMQIIQSAGGLEAIVPDAEVRGVLTHLVQDSEDDLRTIRIKMKERGTPVSWHIVSKFITTIR